MSSKEENTTNSKKKLKTLKGIFAFFILLSVASFAWFFGTELSIWLSDSDHEDFAMESEEEAVYLEVLAFEDEVYHYINDEVDLLLSSESENDTSVEDAFAGNDELNNGIYRIETMKDGHGDQISQIGEKAIGMIESFRDEKALILSPALDQRLEKLRLSIAMRIMLDQDFSEEIIRSLNNNAEKIGILSSYANFFASRDRERVKSFLLKQKNWAKNFNDNYEEFVELEVFNAAPVGLKLPDHFVNLKSIKNSPLAFTNFEGKYLLVDFWASWCLPCIEELPYIKEMYNAFHPNHLDVIGISLDQDRERFEDFVTRYDIEWHQYFDGEAFSSDLAKSYGVIRLPTKYLISPDRKVVASSVHAEEMLKKLRQLIDEEEQASKLDNVIDLAKVN